MVVSINQVASLPFYLFNNSRQVESVHRADMHISYSFLELFQSEAGLSVSSLLAAPGACSTVFLSSRGQTLQTITFLRLLPSGRCAIQCRRSS
jgi:hypothetical protein